MERTRRQEQAFIIALALLAHWALLVAGDHYWDGVHYWALMQRRTTAIIGPFVDAGYPLEGVMLYALSFVPAAAFIIRLLAFGSLVGSALLVHQLATATFRMPRIERVFIAAVMVVHPVFVMGIIENNLPALLCMLAFFAGAWCALTPAGRQERIGAGPRVAAHACFLIAFVMRSFLVLYFGFLLVYFLTVRRPSWRTLIVDAARFVRSHIDFCVSPFVYWYVNGKLFPNRGLYATNDQFVHSKWLVVTLTRRFAVVSTVDVLRLAFAHLLRLGPLMLVGVAVALAGVALVRREPPSSNDLRRSARMAALGALLLLLAVVPYAAVGKVPPSLEEWTARWLLLTPLPLGLLLVAVLRCAGDGPRRRIAQAIVLGVVSTALAASATVSHLQWLARAAKDRSVMRKLAVLPGARDFSRFILDDQLAALNGVESYRFYEWSAMMTLLWGDDSRLVVASAGETEESIKPYRTSLYHLGSYDPLGCEATLTIAPGPRVPRSRIAIGATYVWDRLVARRRLNAFLDGLTDVRLVANVAPRAAHCRR